ncbi:MAG: polyphosphate polymerase domain-containing protein [Prevotellaceae bacterium]|jgi:hypothetical protein|nr:polyphosphate polymerase domain-containing protein [Prevotellaceae bacterium]
MQTDVNDILAEMRPILLDEMENIRLMDRVDAKFVAPTSLLLPLLEQMSPLFRVQQANDARVALYRTQYLDTPDCMMFVMHQNGKLNRQKIRIRTYVGANLSFLEVKNKNNKGRTSKKRVPIGLSQLTSIHELGSERLLLEKHSLFATDMLEPSLANSFRRITFVNNRATERITIDFDLDFLSCKTGNEATLDKLMVLELKQQGWQRSDFSALMSSFRIKRTSFSKYCMGTVLTNANAKYNRFKSKWMLINKLIQ